LRGVFCREFLSDDLSSGAARNSTSTVRIKDPKRHSYVLCACFLIFHPGEMSGCSLCAVQCAGMEELRAHYLSEAHRQKMTESTRHFLVRSDLSPNANYKCDPCGKRFAGSIPYKQHLESEKHKKKVRVLPQSSPEDPITAVASSMITEASNTSFIYCEPCGKKFVGPVPHSQHLISEKHLKRMREFPSLQSPTTGEQASQPGSSGSFSCPLCNVTFTTEVALREHSATPAHRIQQVEQKTKATGTLQQSDLNEKDFVIKIINSHTREFLVCPAEKPFAEFLVENNLLA